MRGLCAVFYELHEEEPGDLKIVSDPLFDHEILRKEHKYLNYAALCIR